ncbi:MAG: hypothetical protein WA821_09920 [Anaerolineales bacterium]
MFDKKFIFRVLSLLIILAFSIQAGVAPARAATIPSPHSDTLDPTPPAQPVKLIFIHHSTGENLLRDDYGQLGIALKNNNYFVSDTNYGWGPNTIGDRTDIPNWTEWFESADTPTYMNALYNESGQHSTYTRLAADPGGENEIIMFKSCFPNSALEGNPNDPPDPNGWLTVGHAKWVYNQILQYFALHPNKLFVVITAPPLQDGTYAANARAFNQWLMNTWLTSNGYTLNNVAVFDFYNVLTGPNNHHRYINGAIEHVFTAGMNTEYYPSGDDHPNITGSRKAVTEYVPLLNIFYNRWRSALAPSVNAITRANANPTTASSVDFTVKFSEAVTGVDASDFALTTTGSTLTGTSITALSGSGDTYTVSANTGSGSGALRLNLIDDDTILDADSNPLGGPGAGNGNFTTGQAYVVRPSQQTLFSIPAQDGWILESGETSSVGGTINSTAATVRLGDDPTMKQYRGILSFNTRALPDTAVVTGVTLKIKQQAIFGGGNPINPFQGMMADVKKGPFGVATLQTGDFQAPANKSCGPFTPALAGGWYSMDLTSASAFINKLSTLSGVTQIRLRFKLDDNNNAVANILSLYSGNTPTVTDRPQLVITYYVP